MAHTDYLYATDIADGNIPYREPNLVIEMGETPDNIRISLFVKRTLANRFKYWMFTTFFPFKMKEWK